MSKTLTIQRDRRYLAREEPAEGLQFARSESCFIFDQHGKKYIDFTAGWCVGNLRLGERGNPRRRP